MGRKKNEMVKNVVFRTFALLFEHFRTETFEKNEHFRTETFERTNLVHLLGCLDYIYICIDVSWETLKPSCLQAVFLL